MISREAATEELKKLLSTKQFSAEEVMSLIKQNADPNTIDKYGYSLIARLAKENKREKFTAIIEELDTAYNAIVILPNIDSRYLMDSTQFTATEIPIGKGSSTNVSLGSIGETEVAIKTIFHHTRFAHKLKNHCDEILFLNQLKQTPNVIEFIGYDSLHYQIVMEFAVNGSLKQYIQQHSFNPLHWGVRLDIFKGIICGLAGIHQCDILHRDINSANIFLLHNMQPKIGNFDYATKKKRKYNQLVGSPDYMAPEIFEDKAYSEKSDIYGAGIVLEELIFWKPARELRPKEIESRENMHKFRLSGQTNIFPESCPNLFSFFYDKCTAIKPLNRPDAEELCSDLKNTTLSFK